MPHMAAPDRNITSADRLGMTTFVAIVAHVVLILGVVFVPHEPMENRFSPLDIVLVQPETQSEPEQADFLAQANQDGGGDVTEANRPATPLPSPPESDQAQVIAATPPVKTVEPRPSPLVPEAVPEEVVSAEESKPIIAMIDPDANTVLPTTRNEAPQPRQKPKLVPTLTESVEDDATPTTLNAATLINRSLAMASLSAEINQRLVEYAERPRRTWIHARTREYKYASYMEAWRLKVERIGNLNYPDEARRKRLNGNLLLEVALNPDGSLNDIVLRRSSGHRVLDDAAIRIVKLSAPFAPLPEAILEDTDILHIERTWRFLNSSRFSGG